MLRNIKRYLPKSLYRRALLIIIMPVIFSQAFAIYMFYERHWSHISRHMAASLAGEVTTIVSYVENTSDKYAISQFLERSKNLFALTAIHTSNELADKYVADYMPISYREYEKRLRSQIGDNFKIYASDDGRKTLTRINLSTGDVLLVEVSDKRLFNSSTYIFIGWMILSTLILTLIAIIFLRNQIRPIVKLARSADNFGRGHNLPSNFKPEGAKEIRQAANAFLVMKERISRYIRQRTEMLAGISHDLRTPLTRMKLELALLSSKYLNDESLSGLEKDVHEMESMVNSYLEFVRGDEGEEAVFSDIDKIILPIIDQYKSAGKDIKYNALDKTIRISVRPLQIARIVRNLVENALKFGTKVEVSVVPYPFQDSILIVVDDNGSGIPANMREDVFKPFFRMEESRNKNTGGIGLGLSIVRDIVHSHGGTIELGDSEMGGLRAMVKLPA